jgi:hypothetical protein
LLCIIALAALIFIIKLYKENQRLAQEQLNKISEEIQLVDEDENVAASSYDGIVFNEINEEGSVELYNSSSQITLTGMSLLLDGELVMTITEETSLDKGDTLLLEFGRAFSVDERHILSLVDDEGSVVRAQVIEPAVSEEEMSFSYPAGFYSGALELEINIPDGMEVYYTLDGTTPTTDSTLYEKPINITNRTGSNYTYASYELNGYEPSSIYMGTVVRAILVNSKGKTIQEKTASYYIGIGNNSSLANIPVISITTDPDNLFDYFEGIYVKGRSFYDHVAEGTSGVDANYYYEDKRSAYIEYYEPNKDLTYEGDVEINVVRDYSVTAAQKSIKVTGEGAWAGSSLEQFFNSETQDFTLETNKRDNDSKTREYLINDLLEDTEVGTANLMPCTVFVDGEYWGLYMIRQKYDTKYFEEKYGITDEYVILAERGYVEDYLYRDEYIEFYNQAVSIDMSEDENYQWAKDNMDIQSYLDYFCASMYVADVDYGTELTYAWKTASVGSSEYADGRWRWLLSNLDYTAANNRAGNAAVDSIDTYLQTSVREDLLFRSLLRSDEFRSQLKETMQNMIDNVFESSRVEAKLLSISDRIGKAVAKTYERFNGYTSTEFYSGLTKTIQSFFENRGYYMSIYTQEIDGLEERFISLEGNQNE